MKIYIVECASDKNFRVLSLQPNMANSNRTYKIELRPLGSMDRPYTISLSFNVVTWSLIYVIVFHPFQFTCSYVFGVWAPSSFKCYNEIMHNILFISYIVQPIFRFPRQILCRCTSLFFFLVKYTIIYSILSSSDYLGK